MYRVVLAACLAVLSLATGASAGGLSLGALSLDPLSGGGYGSQIFGNVLTPPVYDAPASAVSSASATAAQTPPRGRVLRRATPAPAVDAAIRAVAATYADRSEVASAGLDRAGFARLFRAMIQHESGFDPRAVSPKGAMGLGQLMPQTARALGVARPFDVDQNLSGAARYLVAQLGAFGDPSLALAAYNAGPGAVRRYGGVPPYAETRAYVAAITSALN